MSVLAARKVAAQTLPVTLSTWQTAVLRFRRNPLSLMWLIIIVGFILYARLLRGEILSVRERDFVEAARAMGANDLKIILRHVLPNSIYPILVVSSLDMGSVVVAAAALSFLGLGAPVGYADWGQIISLSRNWIIGSGGNAFIFC